jgi:hypothetical protein
LNLSARLLDREGGVLETHAYVSRVSPIINAETGTFKVWVSPPKSPHNRRVKKKKRHTQKDQKKTAQNQRAKLKPGLFVTAEITLDQHHNALLIPREAVMYREGTPFVVRTQGGRARITKVKLGFTEEAHVEVIEPLKEGERIVSFGQRGLEEGGLLKLIEPSLP